MSATQAQEPAGQSEPSRELDLGLSAGAGTKRKAEPMMAETGAASERAVLRPWTPVTLSASSSNPSTVPITEGSAVSMRSLHQSHQQLPGQENIPLRAPPAATRSPAAQGGGFEPASVVSGKENAPPSPASLVTLDTSGSISSGFSGQSSIFSSHSHHQPQQNATAISDSEADLAAASSTDQEHQQAAEQAETGIVADDDIDSDGGYGSGDGSSASTSLASSITDYVFENGRRYHRFREGTYNFPNDDVEQEREDMKHIMVKQLCQQLHFAPIGDAPQQILDIGTGTGIWAIEMGDKFPSAAVLGIDLSPIQPEWVPPNVKFMVDDAESPWLHPRNHFDYIHSRHTIMAIKDWPRLLRRAYEHLRPGGWIEMQEIHHFPISANNSMSSSHPIAEFWSRINEGLGNLGVDFSAVKRLDGMIRDSGFVNVTERIFQVPIGTWPKNKSLKKVGLYWRTILLDGLQAIALGPLTRGCRWSPEQVEMFLIQVRKAYFDNSTLMYMPLHIIYAQKPLLGS